MCAKKIKNNSSGTAVDFRWVGSNNWLNFGSGRNLDKYHNLLWPKNPLSKLPIAIALRSSLDSFPERLNAP